MPGWFAKYLYYSGLIGFAIFGVGVITLIVLIIVWKIQDKRKESGGQE